MNYKVSLSKFRIILVIIFISSTLDTLFAQQSESYKVIKAQGEVLALDSHGVRSTVRKDDLIAQGTLISTGLRSFVVISDPKGGLIKISPKSSLRIFEVNKQAPNILSELSGRIRFKYTKNQEKGSKVIIKTKTAAVGVRGTDLTVTHNSANQITSTIVHEGKVRLTKKESEDRESLEDDLNSSFSTEVEADQYSGIYPGFDYPSVATKIATTQARVLREYDAIEESDPKAIKQVITSELSYIDFIKLKKVREEGNSDELNPNQVLVPAPKHLSTSEYHQEANLGAVKPRPGGYLDLNTGIYIAPPKQAKFDAKTKTFVQEKLYGGIDAKTGDYVPPKGLILTANDGFTRDKDKVADSSTDLELLLGQLNFKVKSEVIDVIKRKFKENSFLRKLQYYAYFNFLYDSNVTFDLHREVMDVTNEGSGVITSGLTLGHRMIDGKKWKLIPKAQAEIIHYTNRTSSIIDKHDRSFLAGGVDVERHYRLGQLPAKHYLNFELRSMYKDFKDDNTYSFFNRDLEVKFGEKFNLSSKFLMDLSFSYRSYQTHQGEDRGEIYLSEFSTKYFLDKYHAFKFYYFYQRKLLDINEKEVNIWQIGLEMFRAKLFKNTDLISEIYFKETNPTFRQQDIGQGGKITLHKDLKGLVFAQVFYEHFRQKSLDQEFDYKKNVFGLGLSSLY
jgi:hypothetical protein